MLGAAMRGGGSRDRGYTVNTKKGTQLRASTPSRSPSRETTFTFTAGFKLVASILWPRLAGHM